MTASTYADRINGITTSEAIKAPVDVATTENITLSGAQTIDGVAVTTGDRVLVRSQTTTTENGIYDVATTAWTRALDFNGAGDAIEGTMVWVRGGDTYADRFFQLTTTDDPVVFGTSAITFANGIPTTAQLQDGTINWVDGGGTADVITATYSPAITPLVDGQLCFVRATAANATTTPTFAPNGLTAHTIVKNGGVALSAGDIVGDGHELILRYLLASTRWELLNPASKGGDVVGPAPSTDSALAQFDGTTGKLLKDGPSIGVATTNIPTVNQSETSTASATTTTLGTTLKHLVTGTTTITAFAGVAGVTYHCTAGGAFLLTHHATNLDILQTGANITTVADDTFDVYMRTTTTAEIRNYQRASGEALVSSGGVFTVSYTSAEQTITAAGPLTLAHGLGIMPKLMQARLVCKTIDLGYAVGDEVIVGNHFNSTASADKGALIVPDATNLNIRFGLNAGVFDLLNKTTGSYNVITPASWKYVVRAWA